MRSGMLVVSSWTTPLKRTMSLTRRTASIRTCIRVPVTSSRGWPLTWSTLPMTAVTGAPRVTVSASTVLPRASRKPES